MSDYNKEDHEAEEWEIFGDDLPEPRNQVPPFYGIAPNSPHDDIDRRFPPHKDPIICPNCYRVITANNPMVSNKRCHECMTPNGVRGSPVKSSYSIRATSSPISSGFFSEDKHELSSK